MAKPQFEIPDTLGACADLLFELKTARSKIQAQADAIEAHEKAIKEHLINVLPADDADGVIGKLATAKILVKVVPTVEDWEAFYKAMAKKKAWDWLQRRVSGPAIEARWEAGEVVPGVGKFHAKSVSLTKR